MEDIEVKRELIIIDGMANAILKQAEDIVIELDRLDITKEQSDKYFKELLGIGVKLGQAVKLMSEM